MKVYLQKNSDHLWPFNKPASEFVYRKETVGARLERQLSKAGLSVVAVSSESHFQIEEDSLYIQDDVFLSDSLLNVLLKKLRKVKENVQIEIDGSRFPTLIPEKEPESFKGLPIYYYAEKGSSVSKPKDTVRLIPNTVYTMEDGLPPRMHELEDLKVFFQDIYAIHLQHWFDIQTATNVYCRELVAKLAGPANKVLPNQVSSKLLSWQWLSEKTNVIGKNCRIHPTAILEGCIIGDNVEIGPFSYLRASVIDDNAILRERTSVKISYIGKDAFITGTDVVNSYVGSGAAVVSPMLFHVVFGENSFLSGGSGFADFNTGSSKISASVNGQEVDSGLYYLGSVVGDEVFVGANMIFAPGRAIPSNSKLLDNGLLKNLPSEQNGTYVLSGNKFIQIPESFFGEMK